MGDAEEEEVEVGTVPLPPSFAWTDLTKAEIEAFMALSTPEETLSWIAGKFALSDYETNAQTTVLVDFYLWILSFAKDAGFNEEKASAVFTILKCLHEASVARKLSVEEAYGEFKRCMIIHSLAGVEGSVQLFTAEDVALISAFVTRSYFMHYRLYQCAAAHDQERDQHSTLLFVNTPADPPPLASAVMEESAVPPVAATVDAPEGAEAEITEGGEQPAEGGTEAPPEPAAEESEPDKQQRVAAAVAAMLEAKGKLLQSELDKQLGIKMKTLSTKLEGLGV